MSKPTLICRDVNHGREEAIRLAFIVSGISFFDECLNEKEWIRRMELSPFNSLPMLQVDDLIISQHVAILTYIGKRSNLLPETSWEAARVIEVLSLNEKLYKEVDRILDASEDVGGEDDVRKIVKHLLVWRQTIETIIKRNKHSKKYTVGEKLSLADLSLFAVYKWICSGSIGAIPGEHLDKAPHLLNVLDSVIAHPKISEREAKLEPIPSFLEGEYEAAAG
eukprot:Selendium_serpulae@DN6455_c1_g1_i9.p1